MAEPNIPIGAGQSYPQKSASLNRDIIDAIKQLVAIKGDKGDIPAHEWNTEVGHETEIRFENPDGTWGAYVDLIGDTGDAAPQVQVQYSTTGIDGDKHPVYDIFNDEYIHFSFDGGSTYPTIILFKGLSGDQGDAAFPLYIQYSILGGAIWSDTPTSPTNYVRFSTDNKNTWTAGIYVKGSDGNDGNDADNVLIEYSANGVDWHTPYNSGVDTYIRFSVDNGSTWLVEDKFIGTDGNDGADGDNAYLYIAWASDDQGNGFSLTFDPALDYRAEVQSTVVIPAPNASNFTGLWKYVKGVTGDAGTNAYVYVAYASDNVGTDFSLVAGTGLDFMAVLSTDVYVAPELLDATYFTGLWRYTRGEPGVGTYYIELPYDTTLHARCAAATIYPLGWTFDSGDQISNPLSSNSIDLIIYHNLGLEVVDVIVKSKTVDKQTKLIGPVAYATFEDDDTKTYLCIKSFSTTETILGIFIKFHD